MLTIKMLGTFNMENFLSLERYDLLANVKMIETEFSGRKTPVFDNYRGQFFWHVNDERCTDWLAAYIFEHGELHPGQSSKCKIILAGTIKELAIGQFKNGAQFAIREGSRIVAIGSIIEVSLNA
ncbi:MAG: hypothetical protein ACRBCI_04485 [Cellvibrionaceae bacterium]